MNTVSNYRDRQRWIPLEQLAAISESRPDSRISKKLRGRGLDRHFSEELRSALDLFDADPFPSIVEEQNRELLQAELADRRSFFDGIEKTPLSQEQAEAVITFDNRVQVVASAGSGKTSVMVARAAYAVDRGFVEPRRILLLAFNRAARDELEERVKLRLDDAGIDCAGINASTFHSLGLQVIGKATGRKPRLASWLGSGGEFRKVQEIVDDLRDHDMLFRYQWDLFRLILAPTSLELEEGEPDGWDSEKGSPGYRTFEGGIVKSQGERMIADFLYLNGVNYAYERNYRFDTATEKHSQYRPDFYYPDIDLWHEHWALDRNGIPPKSFVGYSDAMKWKRRTHQRYETELFETTFAGVLWGDDLQRLAAELSGRGIQLDWNPDRKPNHDWAKPITHEELFRLVRTFMTHVKSNGWSKQDLSDRVATEFPSLQGVRTEIFLALYWKIANEWQRQLADEGSVDFEDMLGEAARHLEKGRGDPGFDLILVDEFQDTSRARARLIKGLLSNAGRFLLAVGDDWQSINRFAGSDVSIMREFADLFGPGPRLTLSTTFRFPQRICDVSSSFVSANPSQIAKAVRSALAERGNRFVVAISTDPKEELSNQLFDISMLCGRSKATVLVLGRYNFDKDLLPVERYANLDVQFRTVHGSKGLEADYVIVPRLISGTYGFPSTIGDDPVLSLAMPTPEDFPHAEERRLFYVALTRARRQVVLITTRDQMSPFVFELLTSPDVSIVGDKENLRTCNRCGGGLMKVRNGRHGPFLGCSQFPVCTNTEKLAG